MGKTNHYFHHIARWYETYCIRTIPLVSMAIRLWQVGSTLDSRQLQDPSSFCHVNVSDCSRVGRRSLNISLILSFCFCNRFPLCMNACQIWVIDTIVKNPLFTREEEVVVVVETDEYSRLLPESTSESITTSHPQ